MLNDFENDGGFVALKRAAEDREVWRQRERMSKTSCTAENSRPTILMVLAGCEYRYIFSPEVLPKISL